MTFELKFMNKEENEMKKKIHSDEITYFYFTFIDNVKEQNDQVEPDISNVFYYIRAYNWPIKTPKNWVIIDML